jgi:phosphohistidine swiveling domain-containing protein
MSDDNSNSRPGAGPALALDLRSGRWVVYGASGYPAYITPFAFVPGVRFLRDHGRSCQCIALWQGKTFDWLYDEGEMVAIAERVLPSLLADPAAYDAAWRRTADKFDDLHRQLMDLDVATLGDAELFAWTRRYFEAFCDQYAANNLIEPLSFYFQGHLTALLGASGVGADEAARLTKAYATPSRPNYVHECVTEFNGLSDQTGVEAILKKYHYLNNDYAGPKPVTAENLAELAAQEKPAAEELPSLAGLSEKARQLLGVLRMVATLQDVRKAESLMWVSGADRLLKEVARRRQVPFEAALMATWPEVMEDRLAKEALTRRQERCVIRWHAGGTDVYEGPQAERIIGDYHASLLGDQQAQREFKGVAASGGKVCGRAVVVLEAGQFSKVQDGDVLVAVMTRPEYLPIMKIASAFVTDEGGITCHAAIVAREMRKPCVIATKVTSKIIKDGDLVEVDADSGTVRLLERT